MLKAKVQTALAMIFPPSCSACGADVESDFGICGTCFQGLSLISGPVCSKCGVPILASEEGAADICQDCASIARPWEQGRSALLYENTGRALVLALKHGDRPQIAVTAATWLARAAEPLLSEDTLIVPVPLHWSRLVKRRYNQAALLAQHLGRVTQKPTLLDALQRVKATKPLDWVSRQERFERLAGAFKVNKKRAERLRGAKILLVDDVMTSGATLGGAADALNAAGAARVDILTLARVDWKT